MPSPKINVQAISSSILSDDVLMLGESLLKRMNIPAQQPLTLQFGSFRHSVTVVPVPRYEGLRISQTLFRRMGLSGGVSLRLQYRSAAGVLSLGPLIGVLVSREYPLQSEKPLGDITMFCRELSEACQKQGAYIYFFTPLSIGPGSTTIRGWIYHSGWQQRTFPAPHVVYNRLTTRKQENLPEVQRFMKELNTRYGARVFNEKFLDKSEVFDALKKDASLRVYLPESHTLRNFTTLRSMCTRHASVFLKPVRGSLGKGIIRLTRMGEDTWQASHATVSGTRTQSFDRLSKLYAGLAGKMKTTRFLIQQGLPLIEISGRPVDFRALTQKNAEGQWAVTSIVSRTAGSDHFVSNLARGGTLAKTRETIAKSNLPVSTRGDASPRLHRAALAIARGIEDHIPAHFGELGIDLALDTAGNVWLLEVNSKPSKNDNSPLTEGKVRPSVRMMILYARFLSGF
jgi:glutathione synthase/RimK-type ligase-like ATP-grasp enzyme